MAKTKEYLVKAQVIKNVANKIIDFLAQIEDFQKKMYLKKKLVVSTNYCITLDRIPEKMYPEIIQNDEQRKEWVKLFAIDEIKAENIQSLFEQQKVGYSETLTIEFLKQNPYLVLDTKFFSDDFKERLVESIDDLDENTNGLLINSDNFQALRFLSARYINQFDCGYYDPPYNTTENSFLYKNGYKDSSWASMMNDRLYETKGLLTNEGVLCTAIDDYEENILEQVLNINFGKSNKLGTLVIETKPSGRTNDQFLATSHEYILFYAQHAALSSICFFPLSEEQMAVYKESDEHGVHKWRDFMRTGGYSTPEERPNSFYPIYFNEKTKQISLEKHDDWAKILPIDTSGKYRVWRKTKPSFLAHLDKNEIRIVNKRDSSQYKVQIIDKIKNGVRPKSVWTGSKYDASTHGSKWLKALFGNEQIFSYPKSKYAVYDTLYTIIGENPSAKVIDVFGGSGTTAEAVINLNRDIEFEDEKPNMTFTLIEMGEYFDSITKVRIEKVIYSREWANGKPKQVAQTSQCFKYLKLESYEDSLNNIKFNNSLEQIPDGLKEEYLLKYMINMETKESVFNVDKLAHPFNYVMDITEKQESKKTVMDIVESFNYLIGLIVEISYAKKSYDATFTNGEYGVLEAHISDGTAYTLKLIEGHSLSGDKILVIWRDMTDDIAKDNAVLDAVLAKKVITVDEFDRIYVNGDNNLNNTNGNKVFLIEDEMRKRMFED